MEDVKGSPIDAKRHEASTFAPATSLATLQGVNLASTADPLVLCLRVATVRPELLLETALCGFEPTIYRNTGDIAEVGFGQHADLRLPWSAQTGDAFERVKHFGARELQGLTLVAVKAGEVADLAALSRDWQPRVHAAFAFAQEQSAAGRQLSDLWSAFGGAYALVPKVSYVQVRGASYLCYLVTPSDIVDRTAGMDGFKQPLERLIDAERTLAEYGQGTASTPPGGAPTELVAAIHETTKTAWDDHVTNALSAIAEGSLQKVVAARFAEHSFERPVSLVTALYALGNTHPDSTKFAFCGPSATFVGATPEHLITKVGQTLTTEALAGTTPSSDNSSHAFTPKEYHEHTPVLDAILSCLAPFCTELTHEVTPLPLRLPHILHLRTAISGSLKNNTHVLDLVRVLHPTPAVAGAPRQAALQWLAQHEDFARGWYAGPLGWFDAVGNGQFDVALRCGVLTQKRAVLFAGAGIVAGSVPDQEFEETVLKLKAMQSALSALPPTIHPKTNGD